MRFIRVLLDILFLPANEAIVGSLPAVVGGAAFTCPVCRGRVPFSVGDPLFLPRQCHPKAKYLLVAAASYDHPVVQSFIQQLKFKRRTALAGPLGRMAAAAVVSLAPCVDYIVPIPLSARRLRSRGFNQADLIAREVSTVTQLPCRSDIVIRARDTKPQTEVKTREQRLANLRGSFVVPSPVLVRSKTILLIDDVWTSGATMGAVAEALRAAGAKNIIGLVIARAG